MTPEDEIDRIIEAAISRHIAGNSAALRRSILESLWEAGYDVTRRLDMIPIVRNPGEGAAPPYTAEQERKAQSLTPAELFRQLAEEPRNEAIRNTIIEIAGKFDRDQS